jgi:hypothetical protein
MPEVVLRIGLPLGRAVRDVIVTFVPRVEVFGDDNNGRTDTGAKFALNFLTFLGAYEHEECTAKNEPNQEYNVPLDVIATRVNLELARKLTVPSRVRVGINLATCQV